MTQAELKELKNFELAMQCKEFAEQLNRDWNTLSLLLSECADRLWGDGLE